jgi:hypothetical protein
VMTTSCSGTSTEDNRPSSKQTSGSASQPTVASWVIPAWVSTGKAAGVALA